MYSRCSLLLEEKENKFTGKADGKPLTQELQNGLIANSVPFRRTRKFSLKTN